MFLKRDSHGSLLDYLSFYITKKEKTKVQARLSLSILNERGQKKISIDLAREDFDKLINVSGSGMHNLGGMNFISIEGFKDKPELLPSGNLTD